MNKSITISVASIIIAAVAFFLGYLVGRAWENGEEAGTKTTVEIKQSKYEVHDTIRCPEPYAVYYDREVVVHDTIQSFIPQVVDTAVILADYFLTRKYNFDFSDDSLGIFQFDATVNQNKLTSMVSNIHPYEKVVTKTETFYKVKPLQFYIMAGTNVHNFNTQKIQFGIDLRQKFLIGVSGIRLEDKYNYTIDLGVKF